LIRATNYRGVTRDVWKFFEETYGGKELKRAVLNIYDVTPIE